jgi:hypothetical protein
MHIFFLLTINMILLYIPSAGFMYLRVKCERIPKSAVCYIVDAFCRFPFIPL